MSDIASSDHAPPLSLHPAKEWIPLEPGGGASFSPAYQVIGAGAEARFLDLRPDNLHDWLAYLEGLCEPSGDLARGLWQLLCDSLGWAPVPQAGPLPDGGFQFVWDRDEHHLEIDVLPERRMEWFYRNRRTGQVAGDEIAAHSLPEAVRNYLALLA
jgi:hypothetical protein